MVKLLAGLLDPLRARLALSLAIALVPVVVYNLLLAYRGYLEAEQRGWDNVRRLAIVASTSQNALIEGTHRILATLAEQPVVREATEDGAAGRDCNRIMAGILATFEEYSDLAVITRAGRVACSGIDRTLGMNIAAAPWFAEMRQTSALTIGYFTLSSETAEPIVSAVLPLRSVDQERIGAVLAGIRLPWLGSLARKSGLPPEGVVYLLDSRGTVMTTSDRFLTAPEPAHGIPQYRTAPAESAMPKEADLTAVARKTVTEFRSTGSDGVERLFAAANIGNGSLFILFGLPQASAMSWSHAHTMLIIFGPVVMLLLAMGTAAIGGELLVSRGVLRLVDVVNAYGRDQAASTTDLRRSPREIRHFAEAFSSMAERIVAREAELKRSAEEKAILLREMHHRVKNNLQVVSSFLSLQSRSVGDETARHALTEARMRVRTLGLVHDHLQIGLDAQFVDFPAFLRTLADQISQIHGLAERGIALEVEVEPIRLPAAAASALALFVTEAVTNAIEHGLPSPLTGTVRIALQRSGSRQARLTVSDDGIGIDHGDGRPRPGHDGIGTSLMRAFAEQLGGEVAMVDDDGTRIELTFPLPDDGPESPPEPTSPA